MFGLNVRILRLYMGGVFAIESVVCLCVAPGFILRIVSRHFYSLSPLRSLLICAIFPVMAIIYGVASWKIWKEKPTGKGWGIAASILQTVLPLWLVLFRSRSIWSCHGESLVIGATGIIVFLWPYNKESETERSETNDAEPSDSEAEDTPLERH